MLFTGLPEYVAHVAVVSLFSALIVLCAFLITKRIFSVSAAYIVAFLVAISRFDVEMLTWAGYPNVITLMLIPLTYYLYLEKERFSKAPFFVSTALLVGSILLTQSLSSAMIVGILAPVVLFVVLWPKSMGVRVNFALRGSANHFRGLWFRRFWFRQSQLTLRSTAQRRLTTLRSQGFWRTG
jgi:hypothetical protein